MHFGFWESIASVCAALLGVLAVAREVHKRVVRPLWAHMMRTYRRVNEVADKLLGDKAQGIPSITDRMDKQEQTTATVVDRLTDVEHALDRYVRWRDPGVGSARRTDPNGRSSPRAPRTPRPPGTD